MKDTNTMYLYEPLKDIYCAFDSANSISTTSNEIYGNISLDTKEDIYEYVAKKFARAPIVQHKCHNCGANVNMDESKNIFVCPYCASTYAVGIYRINDRG